MSQTSELFSVVSAGNTSEPSSGDFLELSLNDQSQPQLPKTNADVPLKVNISCLHSTLSLDISCMGALKQEFAYKRFHVLAQNDPNIPYSLIQNMIVQLYNQMDWGDLIRLVQPKGVDTKRWIQKVHLRKQPNFKQRSFKQQTESLGETLERTFQDCAEYPSAYNVVVVLACKDGRGIKQILPLIKKLKDQHKYYSHLAIFTTKQHSLFRKQYHPTVSLLQTMSQLNFKRKAQLLFSELNQIRIRSLTFRLEPLYGSFTYIGQTVEWHWEQNKLVRSLYSLRNKQKYSQKIQIQGLPRNTEMFVEVEFVSMTGQTFARSACLKIVQPPPCYLTVNQSSGEGLLNKGKGSACFSHGAGELGKSPIEKVKFVKTLKQGGEV